MLSECERERQPSSSLRLISPLSSAFHTPSPWVASTHSTPVSPPLRRSLRAHHPPQVRLCPAAGPRDGEAHAMHWIVSSEWKSYESTPPSAQPSQPNQPKPAAAKHHVDEKQALTADAEDLLDLGPERHVDRRHAPGHGQRRARHERETELVGGVDHLLRPAEPPRQVPARSST